eukprot:12448223-Alexandrium_andersonii.AAC.1
MRIGRICASCEWQFESALRGGGGIHACVQLCLQRESLKHSELGMYWMRKDSMAEWTCLGPNLVLSA